MPAVASPRTSQTVPSARSCQPGVSSGSWCERTAQEQVPETKDRQGPSWRLAPKKVTGTERAHWCQLLLYSKSERKAPVDWRQGATSRAPVAPLAQRVPLLRQTAYSPPQGGLLPNLPWSQGVALGFQTQLGRHRRREWERATRWSSAGEAQAINWQ